LEEGEDVVAVGLVLHQANKPRCRLKTRCSLLLDEDGVLDFEPPGACLFVVVLVVNENEQGVTETINLLPGAF